MDINYISEWYEDDAIADGAFDPDCVHTSDHDDLDSAKIAAFKGASRNGCVQGRATVYVVFPPLSDEDDLYFVNEIHKNKWSGWQQRGID